jgi:single-strand DNA-binding protein
MELNKVMLIGNLTRDPETRTIPSGATVTSFSIAVNTRRGPQNEETLFIKVETWNKTAEIAGQYLQKGSQVLVEGRLKLEEYQTREGQQRRDPVVVADRIGLGSRPRGAEGGGSYQGGSGSSRETPSRSYGNQQQQRNQPQQDDYYGSSGNDAPPSGGGETEDDLPF